MWTFKFQWRCIKIMCICLLAVGSAKGQQFKWAVSGGTWVDDFVNKVVIDKKGNVYSTGQFGVSGSSFGVTINDWGFFIMKQNSAGAVTWIRTSTGSYDAIGQDIAVDSQGNVYVTGEYNYNLVLTDTTLIGGAEGPDAMIFFIKYDSNGNRKWARALGNDGGAGEGRLAVDSHDNIYLAGDYIFNLNFGNGITLTGEHPFYFPLNDVFLSRFSPDGKAIWALSFSTFADDYVQAISTGPDQKVHLMAQYETTDLIAGGVSHPLSGGDNSYIASVDPNGNILNLLPTAFSTDFLVNEKGDFFIAGGTGNTGNFVSKIRSDYVTEWTKSFKTNSYSNTTHIAFSGKDLYIGSSYFLGVAIDSLSATADHGLFTAKISDIGIAQWLKNYPCVIYDHVNTIAGGGDGTVAMGGYFSENPFVLDGHSMANKSGNNDGDIFIALMHDTTVSKCPQKNAQLFASRPEVCSGDSTLLSTNTENGYYGLNWFASDQLIASGSAYYAKAQGDYRYIRYPGTGCADTSNIVHISVTPGPANATPPSGPVTLCESAKNVEYNEAPLDNVTQYSWVIQDGTAPGNTILTDSNSLSLNSVMPGVISITVTGINQCQQTGNSSQITVEVAPRLEMPSLNITTCDGQLITDGTTQVQWYKNGRVLSDTLNVLHVLDSGYYKVSVQNFCGVVSSDSVAVYPVIKSNLIIANVVTPNGDGKNDYFKIDKSLLGSALVIMDRWGGTIFKTESYFNDWTGAAQDAGVYFYCLQSFCVEAPFKGWVQVMK